LATKVEELEYEELLDPEEILDATDVAGVPFLPPNLRPVPREGRAEGARATMRDRLATLIEQFESQHPAITGMLDQVMTTLAGMGV
jgi:hypothetical protein